MHAITLGLPSSKKNIAPRPRFITCIISIGFFGLDAVAEILQSPFGNDPNDIDLTEHGSGLVEDLQACRAPLPLVRFFSVSFDLLECVWVCRALTLGANPALIVHSAIRRYLTCDPTLLQQMFDQHDMEFASVFDDANEFDLTQLELSYKRLGKKAQKDARKSERKRRELQANYSMLRTSGNSNRRDLGKDRPGWSALP